MARILCRLIVSCVLIWAGAAAGQFIPGYQRDLLAKAEPDECFNGIRALGDLTPPVVPPCSEGQPKVNQAYVWGLTLAGSNLWFGTAANVHCLVLGAYLGQTNPVQTASYVGEFRNSYLCQALGVPAKIGDWRPPHIYTYDTTAKQLTLKDDAVMGLGLVHSTRLTRCLGLRSAATTPGNATHPDGVVLLAGPSVATGAVGGLYFFAFDARTGAAIGTTNFAVYNNIRKWITVGTNVYTAIGLPTGGGRVLRWRNDPALAAYPFSFETVGHLDGAGAEIELHEGRLFVSTWPGASTNRSGLWMSPVVPPEGLSVLHTGAWFKVWAVGDYEPDPVTEATYGGGALASFDGYLYWGTMHVPLLAYQAYVNAYGEPAGQTAQIDAMQNTHRAISIFRGRDFVEPPGTNRFDVVYGSASMQVWNTNTAAWELRANKMNATPLYGAAGFGNMFNNYTWTMDVYGGELYVGTMDCGYIAAEILADMNPLYPALLGLSTNVYGADLYRFPSSREAAVPVDTRGVGNYSTYGIRTMVSTPGALYLGMANPMNLLTDTNDAVPEGGWELLALTKHHNIRCDFDKDARRDLTVYWPAGGTWYSLRTSDWQTRQTQWGWKDALPMPGDYDGDGRGDIAVFWPAGAMWYIIQSSNEATRVQNWGWNGTTAVPGDYDGDGVTDLAVYHKPSGTWHILQSSNGVARSENWGWSDADPVPADYDGDGRMDLAVFHKALGNWFIKRSSDGQTQTINWGWRDTTPVPADYDGDGRTDLAVYHKAAGDWYILYGNGVQRRFNWGWSETDAAPGDFDGDGRADLTVYHQSTGRWFVRQSRDRLGVVLLFGWNAAVPVR